MHLQRLRENRHLCVHPAFSAEAELFEPSPELVRLHLVNAINLVLSQEPLQALIRVITDLNRDGLADAIAAQPYADLWPRAVEA